VTQGVNGRLDRRNDGVTGIGQRIGCRTDCRCNRVVGIGDVAQRGTAQR
jgi:hypothetical protein